MATTLGTMLELGMLRHWQDGLQLIPWAALLVMVAALVALRWGSATSVRLARIVLYTVIATGVLGVIEHVRSNWLAAPLDAVMGPGWAARGMLDRLWLATTGGVGPSPTLAPLVSAQAATLGLVAVPSHRRRPGP